MQKVPTAQDQQTNLPLHICVPVTLTATPGITTVLDTQVTPAPGITTVLYTRVRATCTWEERLFGLHPQRVPRIV